MLNMEATVQKILDNYDELSEKEEKIAIMQIRKFAENESENFKKFLYGLERTDYGVLINALSEDVEKWNNFFIEEIKRIFSEAENSENPAASIMFLDEFAFVELDKFTYPENLINFLKNYLKHKLPAFRYWALSLITDYVKISDRMTINTLEQLQKDPDWRIRYWTYIYLENINGKNTKYKLSLIDKIRAKLQPPYVFY